MVPWSWPRSELTLRARSLAPLVKARGFGMTSSRTDQVMVPILVLRLACGHNQRHWTLTVMLKLFRLRICLAERGRYFAQEDSGGIAWATEKPKRL